MNKRFPFGILLIAILTGLDQFTKYLAVQYLKGTSGVSIIPGIFRLYFLEGGNSGAAFGIMQGKFWFFLISTLLILCFLFYTLYRIPMEKYYFPVWIITVVLSAGALGNLIDRCYTYITEGYNYVIDFLYFEWIDFPIFNVADCYITVSIALFFVLFLTYYKNEEWNWLWKGKKVHDDAKE